MKFLHVHQDINQIKPRWPKGSSILTFHWSMQCFLIWCGWVLAFVFFKHSIQNIQNLSFSSSSMFVHSYMMQKLHPFPYLLQKGTLAIFHRIFINENKLTVGILPLFSTCILFQFILVSFCCCIFFFGLHNYNSSVQSRMEGRLQYHFAFNWIAQGSQDELEHGKAFIHTVTKLFTMSLINLEHLFSKHLPTLTHLFQIFKEWLTIDEWFNKSLDFFIQQPACSSWICNLACDGRLSFRIW